ncbi:MAG TPA: lysine--tRNA ligase [Candidatus Polarisedimenticolia bacterium]|nr:lysine--tRNA ligase [Candidatus Polarisedimenticolia bacterium]
MPRQLWPHQEAEKILKTFPEAAPIVLETGYGPSGAPHIGTFAEVARTSWVGRAIERMSGRRWRIIAFSDDMDGLRKVPLNMPREALEPHLGRPLSLVPDPFGCHASYGAHNNARLREMLDRFGFVYTFKSSYEQYTTGAFNDGLSRIMKHYEAVREVILPTIREEKRRDWSPFFPICEACGRINGTRVTGYDAGKLTVTYRCEGEASGAVGDERSDAEDAQDADGGRRPRAGGAGCGHAGEVSVLDGKAKVGWKVDWALRWHVLGVHYEMYGKDLIESAALSARICRSLAGPGSGRAGAGPLQSFYEMFLDEHGRKISKSVGRGLTVDTWLSYAPKESLLLFIFKDPRKAKKLTWDVVARSVDEYLQLLQRRYAEPSIAEPDGGLDELDFIQPDLPPACPYDYPVSYSMLSQLIAAIGVPSPGVVKDYVHHYKGAVPQSDPALESLIQYATAYVRDQVLPTRTTRPLTQDERPLLVSLADYLVEERQAEEIQTRAFEIAREAGLEAKAFFRVVYGVLTGQDSGPRLGSFVKLMGQEKVAEILRKAAASASA